ncbi:hypothetical protein MTR67_024317 [Solanum verrucosum]|uniref:Uncharacterized protein n=1 Tax=Solanum verrucosum TaxID=315347 RepID=A0AAF0QYM0_SOLVR|nr:hypothetical protein MTR67_024317 [Solanum verrucosum]
MSLQLCQEQMFVCCSLHQVENHIPMASQI